MKDAHHNGQPDETNISTGSGMDMTGESVQSIALVRIAAFKYYTMLYIKSRNESWHLHSLSGHIGSNVKLLREKNNAILQKLML